MKLSMGLDPLLRIRPYGYLGILDSLSGFGSIYRVDMISKKPKID